MTQASALRSFATTAEFVAGLVPRLTAAKTLTKNEGELLARQLKSGAETALDLAVSMERDGAVTLAPCQSLALRRMIDALKADDSIYTECPEVVRSALADFLMPPHSSAETQIADLEKHIEKNLALIDRFALRIRDLEQRVALNIQERTTK